MAMKLDQSSIAESQQAKPSAAPKLSIFGAKAGFVIPKNKLAGSLVIRGSSTKNETSSVSKEEHNKHVQRKTKWAPDLALEPAVCKGRALAYQIRLEQITKQLKSAATETDKIEGSLSITKGSNYDGVDNLNENEQGKVQHLELERREIIGEILRLNLGYKAPDDYKPILKETKIPLPGKAHTGHSVIGVLIGPESDTQKRLQEETGAIIKVYGTKKINGEKSEICHRDIDEAHIAYEDLHINISADSYDKVDVAVALIDLLLAPIFVNSAATSTTSTVSSAVTSDAVNPADVQLVQSATSQPGLVHCQSYNYPWPSVSQTNAPSVPSTVPVSCSLPNNSFQPTVNSFTIPPYTGQPPHMNTMPRNPLPVPGPPPSIRNIQQPPPQFQANPSVGPPFGQPPGIVSPQPMPSSSVPQPIRPLQAPHASGGWPSLSPVTSQTQMPPQAPPSFMPMRPPISVSPLGAASQQGPSAMMPPSNTPIHYRSQHPQAANFNTSAVLPSRPLADSFPSAPPQGPSGRALQFPAGTSAQPPYPLPMQMRPTISTPDTVRGPSPAFNQVGFTPGMIPSSIGSSYPPAPAPANTSFSQASGPNLRPPHSAARDFTFRPVVSPSLVPEFPAAGSQMGIHGSINPGLSHAPFLGPRNQGFHRPLDGRPMSYPRMHAPPPYPAGPFPSNQLPAGFHPAPQPGGRMISPPMPAPSNMSNFSAPRPFQLMPRPQQNPFVNSNRQGGNPIYDPLAPTAASGAKKTEAESEYEDLMASVGVK